MTLPAGPKTHPYLQLIQWIANPLAYMDNCAKQYGDIFTTPLARQGNPIIYVSNPQAIQEILTGDTKQFEAPGEANQVLQPLVGDQSMILLGGQRHRRHRQLLMPPFHGDRMRNYGQLIVDITNQAVNHWTQGETFSARSVMQKITLRVILQAVFGLHESPRYEQLQELTGEMLEGLSSPFSSTFLFIRSWQRDLGAWSPWGRFLRQKQQIDALLYAEIEERRQQGDTSRTDILSLMMSARDEEGQPMTDEELRDELLTLLFAGHETTATGLAWALYWTHSLPAVRERLVQELDALGENPDPMEIFRLPYLTAVCQETLRIRPVAMLTFPRVVKSPVRLMGYELEEGTAVIGCIYLTHQREDLYPEPNQFKPERFLDRQFSPYEYLPFGGGSRRCIGLALAQLEMKLVLATILSNWQLSLADKQPVQPVRRGVTLAPAGGVRMTVIGERQKVKIPVPVA
ncbi:cytochrome P450 [Microcoleus sp. FACHB-672]|uniref:cytochrome P450 n=1 Tax=Microcoleus sp. FACHB-672 TaxID=2692825 RepID=UPI0016859918|nr:cytochrome P450 [Microcoleus sp. FACHB-672]MBD2039518.1 cytochrome P450 [Microcoleus sp. FACHB-672]